MGQGQSSQAPREVPVEELSHQLALRFASKCYTHLEIAHFKDNFKTLADHQDDLEYWKEDTLCRFLSIPGLLNAGSILYQMCTYLGAFPFPSLAPCILTREAMLKVVTIMTGRYKKILKRGRQDRVKLLFRSLAVFDRRASMLSSSEKPSMKDIVAEQKPDDMVDEDTLMKEARSHATGFAIDEPMNDEEDEDDDDLALAALDALDAIEVFKHDRKVDRKIHHAIIPVTNFKKLVTLLLFYSGLEPLSNLSTYAANLTEDQVKVLDQSAAAIVAAFDPDTVNNGIRYNSFVKIASTMLLDLFEPMNAIFEHFLFSKNMDLLKRKAPTDLAFIAGSNAESPIHRSPEDSEDCILSEPILSQLSASLKLITPTSTFANIYQSRARFNLLYSAASHGTSLSSFSRQIHSWESATMIVLSGTSSDSTPIMIGAYLPERWRDSSSSYTTTSSDPSAPKATMFQLRPRHAIFPPNPYNRTSPPSYFSNKTGIALGCVIPKQSRTNAPPQDPILGPVAMLIDSDLSTATFQHNGEAGSGAFLTDPGLEEAQREASKTHDGKVQGKKVEFEIDALEVWGISFPDEGGEDEVSKQQKKLAWEEAEAARRRGVNFGGDKDGARALLEMAGLVGDKAGNRSGGSV